MIAWQWPNIKLKHAAKWNWISHNVTSMCRLFTNLGEPISCDQDQSYVQLGLGLERIV